MDKKKIITRLGFALCVMTVLINVVQILIYQFAGLIYPELKEYVWFGWMLLGLSFYVVGFPTFWILSKDIPDSEKKPLKPMRFSQFIVVFIISIATMYIFNFVSLGINAGISLIKGSDVANPLQNLVSSSTVVYTMIFAGLLSPIVEEVIFRGILMRKMRCFGDKIAIITTAVAFGLFHGNLSQFFYAVALGLIFGYITVKTNTIRYAVLLHICINLFGTVIMPILASSKQEYIVAITGLAVIALIIMGIILFLINSKHIQIEENNKNEQVGHLFKNYGVISYSVVCVLMIAFVIIS